VNDFGVVLFDDEKRPGNGWASVAGQDGFRICGTADLPSDVLWWMSLDYNSYVKQGGLHRPNMRRADYIRPGFRQLQHELGLVPARMPAAKIVEVLSEIFARVMRNAIKHYGIGAPYAEKLTEDIYAALIYDDKSISREVDQAVRQAHQTWTLCEVQSPYTSTRVDFRRPRVRHAHEVLGTPIPGQQWEFIAEGKLPTPEKRVDWLIKQERPALVKTAVVKTDPEVAPIIAFGSSPQRGSRDWMTHPELLFLSKFAKIRVDAVFLGGSYEPFIVRHLPFDGGKIGPLSVSAGLLSENYWYALAMPRPYRRIGGDRGERLLSPRAAWLAASDRLYSMMPAMLLHASGLKVRGYGLGRIDVAVQRGALADARACAAAAGLLPPLYIPEEVSMLEALAS
jgi:hypothetical protein